MENARQKHLPTVDAPRGSTRVHAGIFGRLMCVQATQTPCRSLVQPKQSSPLSHLTTKKKVPPESMATRSWHLLRCCSSTAARLPQTALL